MVDKNSTPFGLEINSAPSLTSEYRQMATAKAFDWMILHSTRRDAFGQSYRDGWKGVIHPAISSRATNLKPPYIDEGII